MTTFLRSVGAAAVVFLTAWSTGCSPGASGEEAVSSESNILADHPLAEDTPAGTKVKVTADFLNLRSGPGMSFEVLTVIPQDTVVEIGEEPSENGFFNVSYANVEGWSSGKYLERVDGDASSGPEEDEEDEADDGSTPVGARTAKINGPKVRAHVQTFADRVCEKIGCEFEIGTRADHQPTADRAIDMMQAIIGTIPKDGTFETPGKHGTKLTEYGLSHWDENKLEYMIWYQRINSNDGRGWRQMEDRGSLTENHRDHVHVAFDE